MEKDIGLQLKSAPASVDLRRNDGLFSFLTLIDLATIIYIAIVTVLILAFHQRVAQWHYFILGNLTVVALLLYTLYRTRATQSKVVQFLKEIYPLFLFTFMFKEIALVINLLFPFWLEKHLIHWDLVLFGDYPIRYLRRFASPGVTEFMAFSYWSYYLIMPLGVLILCLRRNKAFLRSFVFNLSLTMYTCYLSYLFLTARGPRETLPFLLDETGPFGFFYTMVLRIQAGAAISGAAFPSSHVSAMWVVLIYMFRSHKGLGLLFMPLIVSLTFSTVYLNYHYAADAIAGALMVSVTYPLGLFIERKFNERRRLAGLPNLN